MATARRTATAVAAKKSAPAPAGKKVVETMMTPVGIAAGVHLVEPKQFREGPPKFLVTIKFPKEPDGISPAIDEDDINAFATKFDDLYQQVCQKYRNTREPGLKDGDADDYEPNHGYWVMSLKSNYPPEVQDARGKAVDPAKLRGGDLIRASVTMKEAVSPGNIGGLSVYLQAVQIIEKRNTSGGPMPVYENGWVAEEDDEAPAPQHRGGAPVGSDDGVDY